MRVQTDTNDQIARKIEKSQLSLFKYVALDSSAGGYSTISDMAFDNKGTLWLLSTIANVEDTMQRGGLHRINKNFKSERMLSFPQLKPEGLAFNDSSQLMIVFDLDAKQPKFCLINLQELSN